jgi:hypothetical protein
VCCWWWWRGRYDLEGDLYFQCSGLKEGDLDLIYVSVLVCPSFSTS